ncbi:sodium/pantothenate symporter [Borreliella burgdorferi]|uniref:Sodium/pantothenate symporter n=2 Tax=Borreliella burgdorferi TaxID=139 RepID=A0A0H3C158_BORBZ|nr:sodium/pantothenate symporter [Borreliella burgdorferi]ACK74899.1 sodium/pantothenate symporter [Borreliella burgdorferi ZS7]MCD2321937.1 sodium/pantothenate symporter [Borreliella burgdorferi]MCD2380254.1 sodium/pantothenate symporter [Borreliella burgdorferi]MCD2415586.1 sodium/pantothenate symporter [Borreliella burgdorferi]MCS2181171.1 sodium/pantothenate symporter [Borreliella burgdorferi]
MLLNKYFLANRNINFIVMALLFSSSYISASSFISGPSAVYKYGLSFILLATIQIPTTLIVFIIVGQRLNRESKKINAINIIDYIRYRYESDVLALMSGFVLIFFSMFLISAQLIGGAKLIEVFWGIDYVVGLTFFAFLVFIYVFFGGFKAVAYTDLIQGFLMLVSSVILFSKMLDLGGGINNLFKTATSSLDKSLLLPSNADLKPQYIISFWILIGIGILGQPQIINNFIAFKDENAIKFSLPISTFIISFLIVLMHLIGFFAIILFPDLSPNDKVVLNVALKVLNPFSCFMFFIGLLSAIMSTVDSNLLLITSVLIKSIFIYKEDLKEDVKIGRVIMISNIFFILIILIFSLFPPNFLFFINIFAFGALEVSFFPIIVFGLYLNFVSKIAAFASMFLGLIFYLSIVFFGLNIWFFHPVFPSFFVSIFTFLVVNFFCKKNSKVC